MGGRSGANEESEAPFDAATKIGWLRGNPCAGPDSEFWGPIGWAGQGAAPGYAI